MRAEMKVDPVSEVAQIQFFNDVTGTNAATGEPYECESRVRPPDGSSVVWSSSDEAIITIEEDPAPSHVFRGSFGLLAVGNCSISAQVTFGGDQVAMDAVDVQVNPYDEATRNGLQLDDDGNVIPRETGRQIRMEVL